MKTKKFNIVLIDKFNLFIPVEIFQPFADKKMSRVKVITKHLEKTIEFYAAIKMDKKSEDYKMMFSKQKQKELNLELGNEFQIQLFEDISKYGVEMPEELDAVLMSDYDAYTIFENLTKGKQRSIIYGVLRFKNSQQKIDKSLIMCENLKRGNHEPIKMFKLE
jgi:hypothetical protein